MELAALAREDVEDRVDLAREGKRSSERAEARDHRVPPRLVRPLLRGWDIEREHLTRPDDQLVGAEGDPDGLGEALAQLGPKLLLGLGLGEPADIDSCNRDAREHRVPHHRCAHQERGARREHDERNDEGDRRRPAAASPAHGARGPGGDLGHGLRRVARNVVTIIRVRASSNPLRELPSVDELTGRRELEALVAAHGRVLVVAAARAALERAREDIQAGYPAGDLVLRTERELAERLRPRLRRVLNATGVIVHTNLGRAPLADAGSTACGRSARLLEPRVRPRGRRARHATGAVASALRE